MILKDELRELAERVEAATGPDRELDVAIGLTGKFYVAEPRYAGAEPMIGFVDEDGSRVEPGNGAQDCLVPRYTASLDAAMSLLPSTAVNFDLFDFIGEYRPTWGVRFHDTAQKMGKRAAKEEIARLQKGGGFWSELRGPPRIIMEKAIAEHFLEFYCRGARSPALAVTAAALRARASIKGSGDADQ